jgi:hypothetical protein
MGAWGIEPWQSDGAADWFSGIFRNANPTHAVRSAFEHFDNYDEIRAACHLLAGLGQIGVWPGEAETLRVLLKQGVELLTAMIDPEDEEHDFLELWDDDPEIVASIRRQIAALEQNLVRFGTDDIGEVCAATFGPRDEDDDD